MPNVLNHGNSVLEEPLAIDGGTRAVTQRFEPWPDYPEDVIAAVASTLRSGKVNYWTGEEGTKFEAEFAAYCGARYAVAVANGGELKMERALMYGAVTVASGGLITVTNGGGTINPN